MFFEEEETDSVPMASEAHRDENKRKGIENDSSNKLKSLLWHGGSVYDAWFNCASNQVPCFANQTVKSYKWQHFYTDFLRDYFFLVQIATVLLSLPYSFSQMGMVSGIILQIFYGLVGCWTAYLISVLYVEYRSRKEKEGVNFENHIIQVTPLKFKIIRIFK